MTHKFCYGSLDRMLRDVMGNDRPFGGNLLVLAGDFRQVLPEYLVSANLAPHTNCK